MALQSHLDSHDLEIAHAIQRALLPATCPACGHGRVAAGHRMQTLVGGDFYDFPYVGEGRVGLLIGDVMGHGVSAALLMAMIVGLLRRDSTTSDDPQAAARLVNDHLTETSDILDHTLLCTMFYGVLDMGERSMEFVNAGHPPPIVCNRQTCLLSGLRATCPPLGAELSDAITSETHTFGDEDRVTLYTDGILDARNDAEEWFGQQRLHARRGR